MDTGVIDNTADTGVPTGVVKDVNMNTDVMLCLLEQQKMIQALLIYNTYRCWLIRAYRRACV